MRIFYFIGELKFSGGGEHQLLLTVTEMKKRGHRPIVFVWLPPKTDNFFLKQMEENGIRVCYGDPKENKWLSERCVDNIARWISAVPLPERFKDRLLAAVAYRVKGLVKKYIGDLKSSKKNFFRRADNMFKKEGKPDLIHIFGAYGAVHAIEWANNKNISILYLENSQSGEALSGNKDYVALTRRLSFVDKIISVSEAGKFGIESYWKIPHKVELIGVMIEKPENRISTGNDFEKFERKKPGNVVIGALSRFDKLKGIHLIPQIAQAVATTSKAEFYVVGYCESPDYSKQIEREIEKRNVREYITVRCNKGFANIFHMNQFMQEIDIFLLPSFSEGLPGVIIEAMSYRKPVVAADVGSMDRLVEDGVSGFLVEPGNIAQFAEKLKIVTEDSSLREQFGTAGYRKYINNYTPEIICKQLIDVYGEIVGKGRAGLKTALSNSQN